MCVMNMQNGAISRDDLGDDEGNGTKAKLLVAPFCLLCTIGDDYFQNKKRDFGTGLKFGLFPFVLRLFIMEKFIPVLSE